METRKFCGMSWFIVEIDEGIIKHCKPSGKTFYSIVKNVDLIESTSADMFFDRKVQIAMQNIVEGKLVMASNSEKFVVEEMEKLTKEKTHDQLKLNLLMYVNCKNYINFVTATCPMGENNTDDLNQVLVDDGGHHQHPDVLYSHLDDEHMQLELMKLINGIKDLTYLESEEINDIEDNMWLLVQYSCAPKNVGYMIINLMDTILKANNKHQNEIAYVTDGVRMYQTHILRKSSNYDLITQGLRSIEYLCKILEFPTID